MDQEREKRHLKQRRRRLGGCRKKMAFIHERGQPDEAHTECTLRGGVRKKKKKALGAWIASFSAQQVVIEQNRGNIFCLKVIRYLGARESERDRWRESEKNIYPARTSWASIRNPHDVSWTFFFSFSEVSLVSHFVPMCIAARGSAHGGAPFCYLDRCYNAAQHKRSLITADKWIKLAGGIELGGHLWWSISPSSGSVCQTLWRINHAAATPPRLMIILWESTICRSRATPIFRW